MPKRTFEKDEFSIIVTDDDNHEIELPVSIEIENRDDLNNSVNEQKAKEDTRLREEYRI